MDIKKIFNPGSSQLRTNIAKIGNKVDAKILLEKAYIEGVYADTPANRKLGRVGMSYAAYAEKIKEKEKKENSSKDKKDDNFIESITNQLQESLNENSIYCYEVNTKETKKGNIIFEAICSKDDLAGITTMDKSGQKLKENLRPFLGGLELQDISFINYKGEKQIKLTFDF